ncbi:MAG: hypothetical protein E6Q97_38560 [Desulfurellales bacterium]|nr:MAG: hypothetical protein E6Q97_38560 [Desulfurellales bacterium]
MEPLWLEATPCDAKCASCDGSVVVRSVRHGHAEYVASCTRCGSHGRYYHRTRELAALHYPTKTPSPLEDA